MPKLRHPKSGQELRLSAETSIGRSRACVLRLEDPRVSGMHAMLAWKGQGWELRDLGSRNGTYVGGRRLESGARELLTRGAQLAFGSPESPWVLVDDRAPVLAASSGELWIEADGELLVLPDPDSPEVVLYLDDDGRPCLEREMEVRPLQVGEVVEAGGRSWRIHLPGAVVRTDTVVQSTQIHFAELSITFLVSQDEEHVALELRDRRGNHRKLSHRAQHYLLLTLARARAEDAQDPTLSEGERGWRYRDDLVRGLRIPDNQFNVAVFRARQHLKRAGVLDAKALVERRTGSGQLRFGCPRFEIRRP
ncbi:MAG: FHA domain-containing protein [Myxococcota bacterium]|nr:FHA domain-containing protein [Myxococcota bacterium]